MKYLSNFIYIKQSMGKNDKVFNLLCTTSTVFGSKVVSGAA